MNRATKAVLCVDDEPVILLSLKAEIQNRFRDKLLVETAISAEDALELMEEIKSEGVEIIFVISDWQMPGMKGDKLLKIVQSQNPKIHLLLLTGQADKETLRELTLSIPSLEVMSKPWSSVELAAHIDTLIASEN